MAEFVEKFDWVIKLVIVISIVILFAGFNLVLKRVESFNQIQPIQTVVQKETIVEKEPSFTLRSVEELIASAISNIPEPTPVLQQTVVSSTSEKTTSYIPLGSTFVTGSTDWVDVPGSSTTLNLINDYGNGAIVYWEVFLKVAHNNGMVSARLYDATNKIAVSGSEMSTTNGDLTQKFSGKLNFWSGTNAYLVQLKSLNSFEVTAESARIKIIH